jgi:hypothetical protein
MASSLLLSSISDIWNAKDGGVFYAKWMFCAGIQMVLIFLSDVSSIFVGVLWFLPPFLPALALFGFHWRTLLWGGVTIASFVVTALFWPHVPGMPADILEQLLRTNPVIAGLAIVPHVLLLVNVRRRPFLWLLGYPLAVIFSNQVVGDRLSRLLWELLGELLRGVTVPFVFPRLINNCLPGLTAAAIVGLVLVGLMPHIKEVTVEDGTPTPRSSA